MSDRKNPLETAIEPFLQDCGARPIVDAVAEETHHMVLALHCCNDDRAFCEGDSLANTCACSASSASCIGVSDSSSRGS
jgi:hypothetical protein